MLVTLRPFARPLGWHAQCFEGILCGPAHRDQMWSAAAYDSDRASPWQGAGGQWCRVARPMLCCACPKADPVTASATGCRSATQFSAACISSRVRSRRLQVPSSLACSRDCAHSHPHPTMPCRSSGTASPLPIYLWCPWRATALPPSSTTLAWGRWRRSRCSPCSSTSTVSRSTSSRAATCALLHSPLLLLP